MSVVWFVYSADGAMHLCFSKCFEFVAADVLCRLGVARAVNIRAHFRIVYSIHMCFVWSMVCGVCVWYMLWCAGYCSLCVVYVHCSYVFACTQMRMELLYIIICCMLYMVK